MYRECRVCRVHDRIGRRVNLGLLRSFQAEGEAGVHELQLAGSDQLER